MHTSQFFRDSALRDMARRIAHTVYQDGWELFAGHAEGQMGHRAATTIALSAAPAPEDLARAAVALLSPQRLLGVDDTDYPAVDPEHTYRSAFEDGPQGQHVSADGRVLLAHGDIAQGRLLDAVLLSHTLGELQVDAKAVRFRDLADFAVRRLRRHERGEWDISVLDDHSDASTEQRFDTAMRALPEVWHLLTSA